MTLLRMRHLALVVGCAVVLGPGLAGSAETPPAQDAAAASPSVTDAEKTAAKAIFAAQCSWCHGDYGMKASKGPRLAGTDMTQQEVERRIRNGKMGYMPSFRKFLTDEQITLMARYIKSLRPEQ